MELNLINIAHASGAGTPLSAEVLAAEGKSETTASGGLSLDPSVVGFQALNFLVLLLVLKWILYKPLLKILQEREQKIRKGVENAEKAEILLKESKASREKMIKDTRAENQIMIETARQSGEEVRVGILDKAQEEAQHIIAAGKLAVDSEKAKALQNIRAQAVDMVMIATEKLLRAKIDASKDTELIKQSLESFVK